MKSWLSIDDFCSANNNCDRPPYSLPHRPPRIGESVFITASMDDHDEQKRTEQNLFVRSGKSEAELALDVLYYWSYCSHEASRGLSLRQQGDLWSTLESGGQRTRSHVRFGGLAEASFWALLGRIAFLVETMGINLAQIFAGQRRTCIIVRWVHAARQFISIKFFLHPYNI